MADKTIHRFGVPTGLPRTGQVTSYVDYDDAYYEAGIPVGAKVRFIDNADGTITDKVTGLIWAKDGNGAGCNNGNTIQWADALIWAEGLTFAGHSDWRLPNAYELFSICLLEPTHYDPFIDTTFFPNTRSDFYWSATTYPASTSAALSVYFNYGGVYGYDKTNNHNVRAVRGGQLNL